MARIELSQTPVDLIADHSLDADAVYSIQADPEYTDLVHVSDDDNSPARDTGIRIRGLDILRAQAGDGGSLWAWAPTKSPDVTVYINVFEDV